MKRDVILDHRYKILDRLSGLPKRILSLHGKSNVTEFVMHELCAQDCFDLERAAYFVDNPDFDCLKGVAGFVKNEAFGDSCNIWDKPDEFTQHMKDASFNQKVRSFSKESLRRKGETDESIVQEIAQTLGFDNPGFFSWDMKHDNHGLFIYQKQSAQQDKQLECLFEGLCYFGFCPVF